MGNQVKTQRPGRDEDSRTVAPGVFTCLGYVRECAARPIACLNEGRIFTSCHAAQVDTAEGGNSSSSNGAVVV